MRVLVLSSFTKSLLWFRMDLMEELVTAGHQVYALGSDDDVAHVARFRAHGIEYLAFPVSRNGLSPLEDFRTYLHLRRLIAGIAPDKVFVYQAKSIVYGCLAAKRAGVTDVYPLVAGLGSVFRNGGAKNRFVQAVLRFEYRQAFMRSAAVFFQNDDDKGMLVSLGLLPASKCVMLNGSGVNLAHFGVAALPSEVTFLFIGRLLRDKGVAEYLDASAAVKLRYPQARFLVVGPFDTNPSAIEPDVLRPYTAAGAVEYHGEQEDVRPYIAQSSVFVLPSYHEGTPKAVLEAMAMGRPIITTDAPGCRETVVDGRNGFLVEPKSVTDLVKRMSEFIENPAMVARMGIESRRIAEEKYDVRLVNRVIFETMGINDAIPPTT